MISNSSFFVCLGDGRKAEEVELIYISCVFCEYHLFDGGYFISDQLHEVGVKQ